MGPSAHGLHRAIRAALHLLRGPAGREAAQRGGRGRAGALALGVGLTQLHVEVGVAVGAQQHPRGCQRAPGRRTPARTRHWGRGLPERH